MKPTHSDNSTKQSVHDRVFAAIDEQKVQPKPKFMFLCQNVSFWVVWLVTVVLGALATAVSIFTSTFQYYDLYEAMYDNFVTYFFAALPVLWIVAFVVLMLLAIRGLRSTNRGYRFSTLAIISASVGVSLLLGFAASMFGFGQIIDSTLGQYAPMYDSMYQREQKNWNQPSEGRLMGSTATQLGELDSTVPFIDITGSKWNLAVQELLVVDRGLLNTNKRVRVIGVQLHDDQSTFHACAVFPQLSDLKHSVGELSREKQIVIDRLYSHMDGRQTTVTDVEEYVYSQVSASNTPSMKICADIAAVRRISERMQ